MRHRIHSLDLDLADPNESDTLLLANPPSFSCKRYAKMTAYGNHWRVDNEVSRTVMTNYDSGVACFEANEHSAGSGKDYVGELQDILVPNYGELNTPIILFSCTWKKRSDNHGNSTYIRDADGFLTVNFKHNTSRAVDPYVFPSQCSQVFFSNDDSRGPGQHWKVVLRKEARGRRKVEDDDDVYMTTNNSCSGLTPSSGILNQPSEPDLTGAIVLNDADNALALLSIENEIGDASTVRKRRRQQ